MFVKYPRLRVAFNFNMSNLAECLSLPLQSQVCLSWFNTAPWKIICVTAAGSESEKMAAPCTDQLSFPPLNVNIRKLRHVDMFGRVMVLLSNIYSKVFVLTVGGVSIMTSIRADNRELSLSTVFLSESIAVWRSHLCYDHCLKFISRQTPMSQPTWPLAWSENNIKTLSWEDNGARQGAPGMPGPDNKKVTQRMVEILLPAVDPVGSLSRIPELSGGALGAGRMSGCVVGVCPVSLSPGGGLGRREGCFLGIAWQRCIFDPLMLPMSLLQRLTHIEASAALRTCPWDSCQD